MHCAASGQNDVDGSSHSFWRREASMLIVQMDFDADSRQGLKSSIGDLH